MSSPNFDSYALSRRSLLRALGVGAGVAGFAGVVGCAPSGGSKTDPDAASGLTKDDGAKEFAFTTWSMGEAASKPHLAPRLKEYEKQAGVTIKTPSLPYIDFLKQLVLQVQGGQTTGAVQLDITWLSAIGAMGKALDLAPLVKGVGYTDEALKIGQYQGKQIGLPWTHGAIGLVGNSELIDKAGIKEQPETIEDFEAALAELKGAGKGVVPYAAMTKVAHLKDIVVWLWTFGCPVVENDKIVVGDDASVEALTWYKRLYDKGLIGKDMDRVDARTLFGQNRVGLYDDAAPARKFIAPSAKDPDIGEKLITWKKPVLKAGDTPQAMAWGHVITLFSADKGDYAAGQFAKWITGDPKPAADYFEAAGYPPVTKKALADPEFVNDRFAKQFNELITATSQPDPLWVYPKSAQMYETLAKQVQAILIGKSTPQKGLDDAREAMQKLIS